jgi:hypothetical protein
MSTPTGAPPQYSGDGRWWWDGQQWVPVSPQQSAPSQGAVPPYGYGVQPYSAAGMVPVPTQSGTDGKAVTSLVLGIVWLGGLGSVVAVILGHISRSESRKQGRRPSGIALAGTVLGYIGIVGAVSLVLLSTLVFHTVKSQAQQLFVKSDLRNAAAAEESFNVGHQTYTSSMTDLRQAGYVATFDVTVSVISADTSGYCLVGSLKDGSDRFYYSSADGETSTAPCS